MSKIRNGVFPSLIPEENLFPGVGENALSVHAGNCGLPYIPVYKSTSCISRPLIFEQK